MPTHAQRLIHAVRHRNYNRLRQFIQEHSDISAGSAAGRTALHAAAEEGDRVAMDLLLEAGADVNARMHNGQTPLHLAATYGGPCDLIDPDADRRDPCARQRHRPLKPEAVNVLAEIIKAKDLHIPSTLGPLDEIAEEHKTEVFLAALDCLTDPAQLYRDFTSRGIDLERLDPDLADDLRGKPRFLRAAELLIKHHADIQAVDNYGASVLRCAIEYGKVEMVELLLENGAVPNCQTLPGQLTESLIAVALDSAKTDVADTLLSHGAKFDPAAPDPMHQAAANGRLNVVRWLLEHGADVNLRDDAGNSPLLAAAKRGHDNIVSELIARGADVHVLDDKGNNVLHAAAVSTPCLRPLLRCGLAINALNNEGQTALHIAARWTEPSTIQALLQAGASANVQDHAGDTPLHTIFYSDECRPDVEFPAFHSLVLAGAERSVKNREGKSAFDLATEFLYPDEYLALLNPANQIEPDSFLWLGNESHTGFLPKALVTFELDGVVWPSSAHYFHAQKSANPELRERIRQAATLDAAICRLREADEKPLPTWARRCDDVMHSALLAKFAQNENLRQQLLATGNATLITDANCESYWLERPDAGFNAIGKMLMNIRAQLRHSKKKAHP